jgi:integrase
MTKGIYKRGKTYWIRYAGLDGRIIFESSHSDKFRDAESLLIKRKQTIREGKVPEPAKKILNHTFKDLANEYRKWSSPQRSYKSKKYFIDQLVEKFGNIPLRQFNTRMLELYQTERIQKGNKPATINRHVATIKHMMTKAVQWDMVEEYALKKVRQVKQLEERNRRLRYLSEEESKRVIEKCDPHLKPIVVMALHTGMRKSEILTLRWENIDLAIKLILLTDTKNNEPRQIPINKTLKAYLDKLPQRIDGGYVFYDPRTDKPYQDIKKSFARALKNAGVKDFHFHDLRHTFASHLVMKGVDIMTVKELLGHKTLAMTLRYAHLAPSHKIRAVDVLDDTYNDKTNYTKNIQSEEVCGG